MSKEYYEEDHYGYKLCVSYKWDDRERVIYDDEIYFDIEGYKIPPTAEWLKDNQQSLWDDITDRYVEFTPTKILLRPIKILHKGKSTERMKVDYQSYPPTKGYNNES
jgi:hypothetical protein